LAQEGSSLQSDLSTNIIRFGERVVRHWKGSTMSFVVRLATEHDVPSLNALIPESVRALSVGYYTDRQIESALVHVFGLDSQLIADGTYYVVTEEDQIAGCGGWSKRKTLYGGDQMINHVDDLLDPTQDAAKIRAFFVHPNWARRGIGRRIMEVCEQAARANGFHKMELGSTLPGEPLYTAMGYTVTERFDITMPDGVTLPGALMVKSLD
jgi:GNAT superfamily N-acetyltransferase